MALLAQFGASPFIKMNIEEFTTSVMQYFGKDSATTEMEVIELQNDSPLKLLVLNAKF